MFCFTQLPKYEKPKQESQKQTKMMDYELPVVFLIENIGGKADLDIYISSTNQEPTQTMCE